MEITRKGFIRIALTFVGSAALGEGTGCGDSGTGGAGGASGATSTSSSKASSSVSTTKASATATSSSSGAPIPTCGAFGTAIEGNHGHFLSIPIPDLDSATDKTYSIQGSADHDHTVTFTPAQLTDLKAGIEVTVTSTPTPTHQHMVSATCVGL